MRGMRPDLKTCVVGLLFFILITFTSGRLCHGYVMPSDQLLDFMTKNFSHFKTLIIIHSTLQIKKDHEKVFQEQISMKSPDRFNIKTLDRLVERNEIPDMSYRQLLMSNSPWDLEQILMAMGIDIEKTAFTRFNGVIAYRIGGDGPACPKLLIEKDRFLPLLIQYENPEGSADDLISVTFKDYREEEKGWYPYEITYSLNDTLSETYSIQTFQTNTQVDLSNLQPFRITVDSEMPKKDEPAEVDQERLENIIKAFEEKYR